MWSNCCLSGINGNWDVQTAHIRQPWDEESWHYWAASSLSSSADTKSSNLLAIFKCHLCIQPISYPLSRLRSSCLPHTIFLKCVCPVTLNQISLNLLSTVWSQCCTGHVHNYCAKGWLKWENKWLNEWFAWQISENCNGVLKASIFLF